MQCPACRKPSLQARRDKQSFLEVDTCLECQGIWFDVGELRELYHSSDLRQQLLPDARRERPQLTYQLSSNTRGCPRCHKHMDGHHIGDVVVDICSSCQGMWLDHGELFRLTQMYKNEGFAQDCQVTEEIREGLKTRSGPVSLLQESLLMLYGLLRSFLGQPLR